MKMKLVVAALGVSLFLPLAGVGKMVEKTVRYELDGVTFESTFVYDRDEDDRRPGILMVPNWMGPSPGAMAKARAVADDDFVVMVVDMYGIDVRPSNGAEAGAAAGVVRADRNLMRARAAKALEVFRAHAGELPLESSQIAAIGFCFGGGTVLELGRSGADLDAVVSFHGDLLSPTLEADAAATRAKVLVLHGAADPYVPQEHVRTFGDTMLATEVDWQLVQFSHAVHSFTDPQANTPGQAQYHPRSAKRAFEMMEDLFDEIWDD